MKLVYLLISAKNDEIHSVYSTAELAVAAAEKLGTYMEDYRVEPWKIEK